MVKIRVLHHSNQLGIGGTEKTMQLFCKYLDKDRFEVHALTRRYPVPRHRIWSDSLKDWLGSEEAHRRNEMYDLLHSRVPEFEKILGKEKIHFFTNRSLSHIIKDISPHILHVHHSGISEPPLDQTDAIRDIPIIFTTNVFGYQGASPYQEKIDRILFISSWLKDSTASWSSRDARCGVLYYPIEKPYTDGSLREELQIGRDIFVVGRIGRNSDDIHDVISLKAYREIENDRTLFLALAPPPKMKEDANDLGIKNIYYLEPTLDNLFLSKFYNTIDVMAHARFDGETFGCVIAEAMIHGKPVVTHRSHIRNAQAELVDGSSGFVVDQHDWKKYAECLRLLMDHVDFRLRMGTAARMRAFENFEAAMVTRKLEGFYLEELEKKALPVARESAIRYN